MNCEWCEEPVLDTIPQVKVGSRIYHTECVLEFRQQQDEAYERQQYLKEKWDVDERI